MALVPRETPTTFDPNAHIPINMAAAQSVPGLDRFLLTAAVAACILAVVGVVLLFRYRRVIAAVAEDKSLDAIAAAVRAKRNLAARIEERVKRRG